MTILRKDFDKIKITTAKGRTQTAIVISNAIISRFATAFPMRTNRPKYSEIKELTSDGLSSITVI